MILSGQYFNISSNYLLIQVIGVPDARMGEEVCAWVKLHKGEKATAKEIKEFCKGKVHER